MVGNERMTPIDGLVEAACSMMDGPLIESMAVLQEAMLSGRALCDSTIAALGGVTSYDLFRAEFRIPSEPPDIRPGPDSVTPQPPAMNVNVYAVVRQVREAIDGIQAGSISIPAICSSYAVAARSQAPYEAKYPQELSKIPVPDTSFPGEHSREMARGHPSEPSREVIKETARAPRAATKTQNVEPDIKRSTRVINEMENIIRNVVSAESIVKEVKQSSSAIEQLRAIRIDVLSPRPVVLPAAPIEASHGPGQGWQPPADRLSGTKAEPVHPPMPIDAARPASGLQRAKADAEANARGLSEALSRSISVPAGSKPAGTQEPAIRADMPPLKDTPATPVMHVSGTMAAIAGPYGAVGNYGGLGPALSPVVRLIMGGAGGTPAASMLTVNHSIEALGRASSGAMAQSPIVSLINTLAAPRVQPAPVDVLVQAVPQQARPLSSPVISLSVGMAAAQAARNSGTSAIREFVRASPSIMGGLSARDLADRNVVNVSMPGVTVEREMGCGVIRTSAFHNTFNISITVKGGSEESDMKELGKKIGRILSDEIKRYGGA